MYNTTCKKGKRCIHIHLIANSFGYNANKDLFVYVIVIIKWIYYIHFFILLEVFCIANSKNNLLINEQIKVPQVLVIGPNGEQTGVKTIKDALTLANYAGLDLVLIGPNGTPPVCKLMDYNKYKYEKSKKEI